MRKGRKTQIIAGIFALQFVLQTAFINTGVTAFADEADAQIPAMTESAETVEETAPAAAPAELAGDTAPADDQTFVPFDAFNDAITMSGTFQMPDSIKAGETVEISGTVTSSVSGLTSLTVGVYDINGKFVSGKTTNPNADRYDLANMNGEVDFKSLEAGDYYFAVIASNSSKINVTLMSKKFTVEAKEETPADTPVEITGAPAFPAELKAGSTYNISGLVTSHVGEIQAISAAVFDASNQRVTGGTALPRSINYDVSRLSGLVAFDTLIAGKYSYRVVVTVTGGMSYIASENDFTVTGDTTPGVVNDVLTITDGTDVPSVIKQGTAVTVKGMVTSASSEITYLTCGVYDSTGRFVTGRSLSPRSKSYDLQRLDSYVTISKLPAGNYTYVVVATNASNSFYPLVTKAFTVEAADTVANDKLTLAGGTTVPEALKKGACLSIRGAIYSSHSNITSVTAGVYDSAGNFVTGKTANPFSDFYDLANLDRYILFNKLTDGEYTYKVLASNAAQEGFVLTEQKFTVGSGSSVVPIDATADKIVLSGAFQMPASIHPGQTVSVIGAVTSYVSDMKSLTCGVYDSNGKFVTGRTINPRAKWFDLQNLDRYVSFNSLPEGQYTFAVIASNASNTNKSLMVKKFTVSAGAEAEKDNITYTNGTNVPAVLPRNTILNVTGTVTSGVSNLTEVSVGIYNSDMQLVTGKHVSVYTKTYDLKELDNAVSFNSLSDGTYYYKVVATNGTASVLLTDQQFTVGAAPSYLTDSLSISGQGTIPTTLKVGQPLSIAGTVISGSSNISALTVGVYDYAGRFLTGKTINPRAKAYNLKDLDYAVEFNKLPAGVYTYAVIASNASNTNYTLISKKITITADSTTPVTGYDRLFISDYTNVPSNLAVGQVLDVYGTVTSESSDMTSLTVGVYDRAGNFRTGKTINPAKKTYNLRNLNSDVMFNQLPAGSYVFAVIATNASNKNYTLVNKSFTVGGTTPVTPSVGSDTLTIYGQNSIPSTIEAGKPLSIYGTVSSGSSFMTSLTCGVYDKNGRFVTGKTINPNARSYDLKKLDAFVAFNSLPAGTYTYAVIASNASNTNSTLVRKTFTVTAASSAVTGDGITIYGNSSIPSTIARGKGVVVNGIVTSGSSPINYVNVSVLDSTGRTVTGTYASPNAMSYNINQLDSAVQFNLLAPGTYYYRVMASNSTKTNLVLVNQSFVVI